MSLKSETVLIIGADGLIGQALAQHLKATGIPTLLTTRRLQSLGSQRILLDLKKDFSSWIVPKEVTTAFICVGSNSLEYCFQEPTQSAQINVDATVKIAKKLVAAGVFTVFLSSNLVFDGSQPSTPTDVPMNPQTEHGRQKAQAEEQLLALGPLMAVLRFSKVLGPNMSLVQNWIHNLKNDTIIHPFSDKKVAPLSLSFVLKLFDQILQKPYSGVMQVTADQDVSYSQWAYRVAERIGANLQLIEPILAKTSGIFLEHLPKYTTLNCQRLTDIYGLNAPNVWETLDENTDLNLITFKQKTQIETIPV